MNKLFKIIKAYEQILLLDINNVSSIKTPHQAYGLLLNLLLAIPALVATNQMGSAINIMQAGVAAFFIIIAWTIFTRILYTGDNWNEILSLHLNLITFWISITIFFILFATWWFEPLDRTTKFIFVLCLLGVFVPVHVIRSKLTFKSKIKYLPLLWLSDVLFTYAVFYK